ncbi:unnamed protein product [Rhodiola kirilowii]
MASDNNNFTALCVPKFDGDYDNWSLIMENLLKSKEYWSMVEYGGAWLHRTKEGRIIAACRTKVA